MCAVQRHLSATLDSLPVSLRRRYDAVTDHGLFTELYRLEQLVHDDVPFIESLTSSGHAFTGNGSVIDSLVRVINHSLKVVGGCSKGACPAVKAEAIDVIVSLSFWFTAK